MTNISKKLILLFCVVLLTTHFSWSQSITITGYTCTGAGSATLALTSNTGITSYSWFNTAAPTTVIATTATTTQPSGNYKVTYVKSGITTTTATFTVATGIVPTAPSLTPATVVTPICGSATQVLTSTTVANYTWKRDGTVISGSSNSITATGNDVGSPGNYSYTVSTTNATTACTSTSNAVVLSMSPTLATPTISAADGTTLICGSSTQTLSATGGGASYVWKRGSTTLANTSSSIVVTGTDATGPFSYTAAIANSAGCPLNFSSTGVTLTLSPGIATPTITTPVITTPICGTATQTLTASSGGTTYTWKRSGTVITGSTNSIIVTGSDVLTPGTYNYTVSTQNAAGCVSSESAPYALKVSPKPATPTITPASFTPNVICGADSKTLTATSGGTTYTWKRGGVAVTGSTTNTLDVVGTDVSVGGTYVYTVSLTNSVGCVSDDSQAGVTLQLFPVIPVKPTITANGAVTFCEGGSVTLNYSRGVTSDMKVWSRALGADTTTTNADGITVRSTNTFTVKTKDVNGCFSLPSNTFLVTVNLLPLKPVIDKGIAPSICDLDSIVLSSDNKGTGNYLWSNGKTTQSILVKTAGNYSLTFTDANTCTSLPSLVTVLTVNPLPVKPIITALRSLEFCYRDFTSLKASSTTANTTFEWDNGAKTAQIDVALINQSTKTEFIKRTVKSISDKGCKSKDPSDEITITVNPLPTIPTISSSGPLIFCPDSTVNLTSTDSPNGVYKWINAKDNSEFSNKKTVLIDTTSKYFTTTALGKVGKFYVRTISEKSCVSDTSKNVTITVREAPQPASILPSPISATVCEGGKVTLKALVANGNVKTYSWRDEATQNEVSTEQEVSVIATGSFTVKVRDSFGCFAANSKVLKVTISPLPTKPSISILKAKIFCDEDSTIVQSSLPSTTANGNKNLYRWIVDGQTVLESFSRTFSWKKASSIAVAVTDSNGCKALAISDTIKTTVNPLPASPSITARGPIPFCADKNVTLSATGANGVTFKWSTGAITPNITTNKAGNITVQAINNFGCFSKPSQGIDIRVNPLPETPTLSVNNAATVFCDGSKVRVIASSKTAIKDTYWWRSTTDSIGRGEDFNAIFVAKTGNYFGKVQDDKGCISLASTPLAIDVRPNPTPTIVKKIGTFSLDAQGVGDENGYIWRYNGDIQKDLTTRIIKAKKDGDYQVQASITYTGVALTGGKLVCYSNTSGVIKYEQDLSFSGFSIFPNPTANGEINVEVIDDLIGATITVYSIYGQLIAEYKVDKFNALKKIQLPDYHGSTFIVKITTDGFDRTRRVVTLKQ
jgi:Ig-like domain CHU_C associated